MRPHADQDILTTIQAGQFLGINHGTLRAWRSQGRGPRYTRLGRLVRYRRRDLEIWEQDHGGGFWLAI